MTPGLSPPKKADKVPTAFAPGLPSVGNEAFSLPHLSLRALLGMRYSHVSAMIATLHASSALVVDPSAAINGPVSVRPTVETPHERTCRVQ